jgi:hypothetical protein
MDCRGRYCVLATDGFPEYDIATSQGFRNYMALIKYAEKTSVRSV